MKRKLVLVMGLVLSAALLAVASACASAKAPAPTVSPDQTAPGVPAPSAPYPPPIVTFYPTSTPTPTLTVTAVPRPTPGVTVTATPAPAPTVVPRPTPTPTPTPAPMPPGTSAADQSSDAERMIVRTGQMSLAVSDIPGTIDRIARLAESYQGYVVSSNSWREKERLRGTIAIRVSAGNFDNVMRSIGELAVEVMSQTTSSKDVTEEYVDLNAKLQNLQATEQQLLRIMEKAQKVEDILNVQRELAKVRGDIEQTKGRMQYLERTSATSLISVSLEQAKLDLKFTADRRFVKVGEAVRFTSQVAGGFAPYSYEWDFGDGKTSTDASPNHDYGSEGTYTVTLKVTDDRGNTDTQTTKDYIAVQPLDLKFTADRRYVKAGEAVRFTAKVAGGLAPYNYEWDFGDGKTSTDQSPAHEYSSVGIYTITLKVTDDRGNTDTQTTKDYITVQLNVKFTADRRRVKVGEAVHFTAQVAGGFAPYRYEWDLGDGKTVTDASPYHEYRSEDTYTVTLKVTDDRGNTDTQTAKDYITVQPGWSPGSIANSAWSGLVAFGHVMANIFIWLGILSPVWLIVGGGTYWFWWRRRKKVASR